MRQKTFIYLSLIILLAIFLRLFRLGENPPALYWDEASLGYNAYAILTTGHDEHGQYMPITRFVAFGDYKPPGYIYAVVPSLVLFGTTEFAIRFPSAMSGILFVILTFFLTRELFKNEKLALLAASFMAVSPWSLHLSRAGFEAHLAAFFHLLGTFLFLKSLNHKPWWLLLSALFFSLTFYTFNANRVLLPIWLLFLGGVYFKELWRVRFWALVAAFIGLIMLSPYYAYFKAPESKNRVQEVSIFNNLDIVKTANERITRSGNSWWAKFINNRRVGFAREYLVHYFDHFRGDYLFIHGDRNPRLSIQDVGEMYVIEAIFILAGFYYLIKQQDKTTLLILGWLLLPVIPAAVAKETPHMLRTASVLPAWQIISASGLFYFWQWGKSKANRLVKIFPWLTLLLLGLNIYYYLHQYWIHYPIVWNGEWQYGYKQMVEEVQKYEARFDQVYITESLGRPYIYFLLYNRINPLIYVQSREAARDWYGFWEVGGFGKYIFKNPGSEILPNSLIVTGTDGFENKGQKLSEVKAPDGRTVFEIGVY